MKKIAKKIAVAALSIAVGATSAGALDLSLGLRGNFNMGLGTSFEQDTSGESLTKEGGNFGGGASIFANFGLVDLGPGTLGVQPEVMLNFNNGYHFSFSSIDASMTCSDNTIDIPLLITYSLPIGESFKLGLGVGPYLSIPLGLKAKVESELTYMQGELESDGTDINFGLGFDLNAGYKVGPGSIVIDVRYLLDLTKTQFKGYYGTTADIFTRRALLLGLGYELKLI